MRVLLDGGPLHGEALNLPAPEPGRPLLLPTNRDALYGDAPPTAPYFAEYRAAQRMEYTHHVFEYVGEGMNVEYEVVDDPPAAPALD